MHDKPIDRLSDQELRAALDLCDFDCDQYEVLIAEAEKRELDI
jgi:hypothetical protein